MTLQQRIAAFAALGKVLVEGAEDFSPLAYAAQQKNAWYTPENIERQLQALAGMLQEDALTRWLAPYADREADKTVGLILAGNIPLVGFHDILCVLIAGYKAQVKVSSDDAGLTSWICQQLIRIEPAFADRIALVDKLQQYDLIVATGSDNSARYFEYYFGKKPHIIRKNRNAVAVITGQESPAELAALGHDIFDYFGLGCRSVSKIYIPKDYPIHLFFEAIEHFAPLGNHHKYRNNYDYNKSIYLINKDKHFDNGFLLLKQDERIASPLAVVFYEEYDNIEVLAAQLSEQADRIQCMTTHADLQTGIPTFAFGGSQHPQLTDYADGVNTLDFLFAQYEAEISAE